MISYQRRTKRVAYGFMHTSIGGRGLQWNQCLVHKELSDSPMGVLPCKLCILANDRSGVPTLTLRFCFGQRGGSRLAGELCIPVDSRWGEDGEWRKLQILGKSNLMFLFLPPFSPIFLSIFAVASKINDL